MSEPTEQLRTAIGAVPPTPPGLMRYLDKVRGCAYTVTDADVAALADAGFSEEEIFEHTVATAVDEGLRRLDAALRAIG